MSSNFLEAVPMKGKEFKSFDQSQQQQILKKKRIRNLIHKTNLSVSSPFNPIVEESQNHLPQISPRGPSQIPCHIKVLHSSNISSIQNIEDAPVIKGKKVVVSDMHLDFRKAEKFDTERHSRNAEQHQVAPIDEFYTNLSKNSFIVVPKGELMEEVKKMRLPQFSIIETPVKKYELIKRQEQRSRFYNNISSFKSTSPFKMGSIGLFQQINEDVMKHMKKRVDQSDSVHVKKFKLSVENAVNPEAAAIMEQYLKSPEEINRKETPREARRIDLKRFYQKQQQKGSFRKLSNERNSSLKKQNQSPASFTDGLSDSSKLDFLKKQLSHRSSPRNLDIGSKVMIERIRERVHKDLIDRIYKNEYERLKERIQDNKRYESLVSDLCKNQHYEEGALCARPSYRYLKYQGGPSGRDAQQEEFSLRKLFLADSENSFKKKVKF